MSKHYWTDAINKQKWQGPQGRADRLLAAEERNIRKMPGKARGGNEAWR